MSGNLLVIYARMPEPGKVKTRLAADIGGGKALEMYHLFLDETMRIALSVNHATARIDYTPASRQAFEFFSAAFPGILFFAQQGDDLGERLIHSFADAFMKGFQKVCLIGSDLPDLPAAYISQGFKSLDQCDVVLGPSEDGGYYLVGLRIPVPELFENMPWREANLLQKTLERAAGLGLNAAELPPWRDVDDSGDLEALRHRLSQSRDEHSLRLDSAIKKCLSE